MYGKTLDNETKYEIYCYTTNDLNFADGYRNADQFLERSGALMQYDHSGIVETLAEPGWHGVDCSKVLR